MAVKPLILSNDSRKQRKWYPQEVSKVEYIFNKPDTHLSTNFKDTNSVRKTLVDEKNPAFSQRAELHY